MIELRDATLQRGEKILFEHADLRLFPGWRVGLSGANGAGKSSLFALIRGLLPTDAGVCELPASWTLATMEQHVPQSEQAAIDYVLDGDAALRASELALLAAEASGDAQALARAHEHHDSIDGYQAAIRAARLLAGLGFAPERHRDRVASFSGGWRMRLGLARALMCRSDALLLDEPTNHLDLDALLWLEQWLKTYPGLLIVIAHDREFLDAVCDHILHLEAQRLTLYSGNYSTCERVRHERRVQQARVQATQERQRAHLQAFVDRFRAQASKARQAQSRLKQLERLPEMAAAHSDSVFQFSLPVPQHLPQPLLTLSAGSVTYGSSPLLQDLQLQIHPGDRIGLLGSNGAGKSTLLRLLAGEMAMTGELIAADKLRSVLYHQHQTEAFADDDTPLLCLRRLDAAATELTLRTYLGSFGIEGERVHTSCGVFSGGERARLALALCIYQRPNLLLLDEPTNHLDIEMRTALTLALQDFAGAVVLVSHDRHLLNSCCERFLLVDGGRVEDFAGDLDDYARWLQGRASTKPDAPTAPALTDRREQRRLDAEKRQQLRPLRQRLEQLERQMQLLQARHQTLTAALADPGLYAATRKPEMLALAQESDQVARDLAHTEGAWLELSEELEECQRD